MKNELNERRKLRDEKEEPEETEQQISCIYWLPGTRDVSQKMLVAILLLYALLFILIITASVTGAYMYASHIADEENKARLAEEAEEKEVDEPKPQKIKPLFFIANRPKGDAPYLNPEISFKADKYHYVLEETEINTSKRSPGDPEFPDSIHGHDKSIIEQKSKDISFTDLLPEYKIRKQLNHKDNIILRPEMPSIDKREPELPLSPLKQTPQIYDNMYRKVLPGNKSSYNTVPEKKQNKRKLIDVRLLKQRTGGVI